ncbi:MAG: hypothetical protein OXH70_01600 [Acidobacteria bacterium]|nr:hypothetical protein [Acidobacteriota bacterium]
MRTTISLVRLWIAPLLRPGNRWIRKAARRQGPDFWRARERLERLRFKRLRTLVARRRSLSEGAEAVAVAWELAKAILLPVLYAFAFVGFLVWFDQSDWGSAPRRWAGALPLGEPSAQTLRALLATGAQVTGVFIGLYFTAISVVASTAYDNVPPELRSVLIADRVGTFYLRVVGFTGAACLFALGALALGYSLGAGSAAAFTLLGGGSILSFLPLGRRVFRFFDPDTVTALLERDIVAAVDTVAGAGTLASDRSFQAHHQKVAAGKLAAWEELVSVTARRSARTLHGSCFATRGRSSRYRGRAGGFSRRSRTLRISWPAPVN